MTKEDGYTLLDSGNRRKLERFGSCILDRPCGQAVWQVKDPSLWKQAEGRLDREGEAAVWKRASLPEEWQVNVEGIKFRLAPTDFGHLGIFPEQKVFWRWLQDNVKPGMNVLNLFAYSGGSTMASALAGAEVCHVDASKGMVAWARENAKINGLENAKVRWIIDDVIKFLRREIKREKTYQGIILDPPSFGRGSQGEVFKIEEDLKEVLDLCRQLLKNPRFVFLSCHTPGYTPTTLNHLMAQAFKPDEITQGEMLLEGAGALSVPSGVFAKGVWHG